MRVRAPRQPALRPVVQRLWLSAGEGGSHAREWVLPTGAAHVVVRLGAPLVVFPSEASAGQRVGTAVVGGPRAAPYLRALGAGIGPSVGAQLHPGALPLVLGCPAHELEGRHLPLVELWGREAELLRERLAEAPRARWLDLFESFLVDRLRPRGLDPVVGSALDLLRRTADVGAAARASGFSHRHFSARFRAGVGLLPSTYLRLLRFQRALRLHAGGGGGSWAAIAYAAGFADQAHLSREFRRLSGMPPRAYAARVGGSPNHVPAGRPLAEEASG